MNLFFCLCLSLSLPQEPADRWFAEDKFTHFLSSFAATTIAAGGARLAGFEATESAWIGAGAGATIGTWKEVRDMNSPLGRASFRDLVWDGAGIAAGTAAMLQVR